MIYHGRFFSLAVSVLLEMHYENRASDILPKSLFCVAQKILSEWNKYIMSFFIFEKQ